MKNKKFLAKQDHFILANYDFNLESSKLLFACLYKANSDYTKPIINQKSHIYRLDFEEIKRISGIDYDFENHKEKVNRATFDLTSKIVQFSTVRNSFKTVGIVKSFDIMPEEKIVEFEIDNDLKPFLVEQFKQFTKLGFDHLSLCKSKYTFRLYEILILKGKAIKGDHKTVKISIEELRDSLLFPKSASYGVFKERVIEKANTEYNALDIESIEEKEEKKLFEIFEYKEIKEKKRGRGRKPVSHIIFEYELLEKTKLLMMSKTEKVTEELKKEDWIITEIRTLIEKNKSRDKYFEKIEINYLYGLIIQIIEDIKKEYEVYGVLNQRLIKSSLNGAFNNFKSNFKNSDFALFIKKGFKWNCDKLLEKNENLEDN